MQANIIVDCERMKYPNTGIYHFCRQLSTSLIKQRKANDPALTLYLPATEKKLADGASGYIIQRSQHKLLHPANQKNQLWHGTYQGSNYYPTSKKVKKILTIHDLNFLFDEGKSVNKQKNYLRKVQSLINRSNQLTAISNFTLQCVREHLNIDHVPIKVIYNGCNLPVVTTGFQQPAFITTDRPFIFSIGTIARKKNFHTLPALLKGNDHHLIIAGIIQDKIYYDEIMMQAKKMGVASRIILPGAVTESEKWWLLSNTHAFVFPSIAEGFGLPVVEAMYMGKPVILSNHTCLPEIGADAAYYFNSFDAEEMQHTLQSSLQHFYDHPQQQEKVRNRAAFFNWDDAAKQYWELYYSVLQIDNH
jgi:glycosyltransferase involved in cell wall biosynthesis